jgi:hypothetical protein
MESSQETQLKVPPGYLTAGGPFPHLDDEEVALGCECANPSLQIDCWTQEAAKPPITA